MANFGGLGGLGGRGGGFGMSFPSRGGQMPNSQTVDYLRPQSEWETDFQSRWAAEAGRGQAQADNRIVAPTPLGPPTMIDYGLGSQDTYMPHGLGSLPVGVVAPTPLGPPTSIDYGEPVMGGPVVMNAPTGPDFSALEAEREEMMRRYDAVARQTQAYGQMNGNGQMNGVMGANYSDPNFGQIMGAQFGGNQPEDDMAWADGLYNPSGSYSTAPLNPKGWSFW